MAGRDWRSSARWLRALGPLGLTLAMVIGAVLLLGPGGVGARAGSGLAGSGLAGSGLAGSGLAGQAANAGSAVATRGPLRIARADAHAEYVQGGQDVELNLALSQTQDDCQAPLNGGVCLRYSVVRDEQGALVGYGVIPASAVQVTGGAIRLRVDTATVAGFTRVMGPDVRIVAVWTAAGLVGPVGSVQRASAQGAVGAYTIPSASAKGASVIATMRVR